MSVGSAICACTIGLVLGLLPATCLAAPPPATTSAIVAPVRKAPTAVPRPAVRKAAVVPPARTAQVKAAEPDQATTAALDLTSLEKRLRETHAIGVFTKISLKNQVDDLLAHVKLFHEGRGTITLAALRERFSLLLLKVLSVLQDGDPALARDVSGSREALWGILEDPVKFAKVEGGG